MNCYDIVENTRVVGYSTDCIIQYDEKPTEVGLKQKEQTVTYVFNLFEEWFRKQRYNFTVINTSVSFFNKFSVCKKCNTRENCNSPS